MPANNEEKLEKDSKLDYQAILPPGIHSYSISGLRRIAVESFPKSKTREPLFNGLTTVIERVNLLIPSFTMYVDGSFLTEKIDPEDVDCVAFFKNFHINSLTERDERALKHTINREVLRQTFGLDFYYDPDLPDRHNYWQQVFGVMRDDETEKGFVRLELSR